MQEPERAFAQIGLITHHFEGCELYLSEMFQLLCEAENDAPFQIFGQIVSSNQRLEMVKTALSLCLSGGAMKVKLTRLLSEFKECQTLRNRAVHSSALPLIERDGIKMVRRPLWHQTMRYTKSGIKPGNELDAEQLADANHRITLLNIELKGVVGELASFLDKRKARRLRKRVLAHERRAGAR